jgi:hypothetical protein
MIATIRSEVPTGRSMKIRDGFMSRPELLVGLGGAAGTAAAALASGAWRASPLPVSPLSVSGSAPLARRDAVRPGWRGA